jgi:CHAT domain-containing protein/uncharacterized protein HemY
MPLALPTILAQTSSGESLAESSLARSQTLFNQGQYQATIPLLQQAQQTYQQQGDSAGVTLTMINLAQVYQALGQWAEAETAIESAIARLEQIPSPVLQAQALDVQGQLQFEQGDSNQALAIWKQSAALYDALGESNRAILSRLYQVRALQALGLSLQVESLLSDIQTTLQDQPSSSLKATTLRLLGDTQRLRGNLNQAEELLEASLSMAEQLQQPNLVAAAQVSLGNVFRNRYANALDRLQSVTQDEIEAQIETEIQAAIEQALTWYRQAVANPQSSSYIQAQLNILSLLTLPDVAQWEAANEIYPQVQQAIDNLPSGRSAIYAQVNLALSLMALKQQGTTHLEWVEIAQALAKAKQQADTLEDARAQSWVLGHLGRLYEQTKQWQPAQELTQQALSLSSSIRAEDISYGWQWQLGRIAKQQGQEKDAIAAYTGAFNTLRSLRRDLITANPDLQFSFRDSVEPIYRELVDLLTEPGNVDNANLETARTVLESLQLAELENFFREACLDVTQNIDQVIDNTDQPTAVLYPILLPGRLEVILKLPDQPLVQYETQIDQETIETVIAQIRVDLVSPYAEKQVQDQASQLYDWLLRPATDFLTANHIDTLVFVLDGSLRNIPMGVLYDGQQYLIEQYAIAVAPGLQLVDPKPLVEQELAVIAAGMSEARPGFQSLPFVEEEINQLERALSSKVLLNQNFTRANLEAAIRDTPFPIIHLATHGKFSSDPEQTLIVAWDGDIPLAELSQLLRNSDQGRAQAIELLVLSACQTASGDNRATLGLAGVAIRAGARSTLASLWNLDDQSSAMLVGEFYQALQQPGITKAKALQKAQIALINNPGYNKPGQWAPFILVGNWL